MMHRIYDPGYFDLSSEELKRLNDKLYDFYSLGGKDIYGRTFGEVILRSDEELEKSHNIIQWLFPLEEGSEFSKLAPILDKEMIEKIKGDKEAIANLKIAGVRFMEFFGKFMDIERKEKPKWISKRNHNYLRITRIIKCFKIFGMEEAGVFFEIGKRAYEEYGEEVGEESMRYWEEAMRG